MEQVDRPYNMMKYLTPDQMRCCEWRYILIDRKNKFDCWDWCDANLEGKFIFVQPICTNELSPSGDACMCHSPLLYIEDSYDWFHTILKWF